MWFSNKISVSRQTRRTTLRMEELENRVVPYSISGSAWPNSQLVTLSFMPDGTDLGGVSSNLIATMNSRFGAPEVWQGQILKAAQVFAKHTNLNFVVVSDNGAPSGSGANQQGDPNFGDIRIGGYNFGSQALAYAFAPPAVNNYSIAGDIAFNTAQSWNIGSTYDLFTVASHEIGHSLGLLHTNVTYATMYSAYNGVHTGIDWDDIYGIRSIYSGGQMRTGDWNDVYGGGNESFSAATDVTQHIQSDLTILRLNRDITTNAEADFFKVTVPGGTTDGVQVAAQSNGLSLLTAKVTVYAADQVTVLGASDGAGKYGQSQTITMSGKLSAGDVIYVKVQSADSTAFSTGKYALSMSFGGAKLPAQNPADTTTENGKPISSGGGMAMVTRLADAHDSDHGGCGCPQCTGANRNVNASILGTIPNHNDREALTLSDLPECDTTTVDRTFDSIGVQVGGVDSVYSDSPSDSHLNTSDTQDLVDLCFLDEFMPW